MPAPKRVRRVPQRTCVGCRGVETKRQLVRVVRGAGGRVGLDPTGKAAGRGAYVHERRSCWEKALSSGALERALKTNMDAADRAALTAHGQQYSDETDT